RSFIAAQRALVAFYDNFPVRWLGGMLKFLAFPLRLPVNHGTDRLVRELGKLIMEPTVVREALSECAYRTTDPDDAHGRQEAALEAVSDAEHTLRCPRRAVLKGEVVRHDFAQKTNTPHAKGFIEARQPEALLDLVASHVECLSSGVFDSNLDK